MHVSFHSSEVKAWLEENLAVPFPVVVKLDSGWCELTLRPINKVNFEIHDFVQITSGSPVMIVKNIETFGDKKTLTCFYFDKLEAYNEVALPAYFFKKRIDLMEKPIHS